ncbi:MAG: murein biosynthesis integral membrane protein MurJ, partial [Woeseia sp.]|nr:murein biosynthesis integral membrane protein MurJ [Woeseia sp.]NNE59829.1 murein biosynthesis integral membrane protein MurJ [Woeseia sp.]
LAVNFVLSVALAWWLTSIDYPATHAGLALAISVAAILNAGLLYRGLRRDGALSHGAGWPVLTLRIVAANAVMILALNWLARPVDWWLAADIWARAGWLGLTVGVAAAVYFIVLALSGLRPAQLRLG